jgi:hypothetical protein
MNIPNLSTKIDSLQPPYPFFSTICYLHQQILLPRGTKINRINLEISCLHEQISSRAEASVIIRMIIWTKSWWFLNDFLRAYLNFCLPFLFIILNLYRWSGKFRHLFTRAEKNSRNWTISSRFRIFFSLKIIFYCHLKWWDVYSSTWNAFRNSLFKSLFLTCSSGFRLKTCTGLNWLAKLPRNPYFRILVAFSSGISFWRQIVASWLWNHLQGELLSYIGGSFIENIIY